MGFDKANAGKRQELEERRFNLSQKAAERDDQRLENEKQRLDLAERKDVRDDAKLDQDFEINNLKMIKLSRELSGDLKTKDPAVWRQKAEALGLLAGDPELGIRIAAGAVKIQIDPGTGRLFMVDVLTGETKILNPNVMTRDQLKRIDIRLDSIKNARLFLRRNLANVNRVGIENIFTAEVGGIALQLPLIGSVLGFLGVDDRKIADIQAARAGFFASLEPTVGAIRAGARAGRGVATNKQLAIAERIVNVTRLASTPAGARKATVQMLGILDEIEEDLKIHRASGLAVMPSGIGKLPPPTGDVWEGFKDKDGVLRFRKRK